MKLSVLIPVYNERYLVRDLVEKVLEAPLPDGLGREIVLVDDGSDDGTREVLRSLSEEHPGIVRLHFQESNRGKGSAVRKALSLATGEFCIFQDADLEYDPADYGSLLEPLLAGRADVVYGSRFLPSSRRRVLNFWHGLGNRLLTLLSDMATGLNLTDMETCYKVFRTELLRTIPLRSNGFGLEPEITAKIAKRNLRIYEVPISYDGRTYAEGKKIDWRDGLTTLATIAKYLVIDDCYDERTGYRLLSDFSRAHHFDAWMADRLRPWLGDRVLELGAGIGNLTLQLLPRQRYVATDPEEVHLPVLEGLASRRTRLEAARLDPSRPSDYDPYRGEVDTVLCPDLLEHLEQDDRALQAMHDVLAPGGRLVLVVPQGSWLMSPLDRALGHRRRYDRAALESLLEHAGFEIETLAHFNRVGLLGWLLNGRLLGRQRVPRLQLKIYDVLVWLWRLVDRVLPWPGLSLLVVARR